jgi:AcrR family transcriptional regulator
MAGQTRTRLSRRAWVQAALDAIAEGGLAAVAVVPLAKQLGATKGSFYWHFANRGALVEAALADWEQSHTAAVIAEIEASSDDPLQQLRRTTRSSSFACSSGVSPRWPHATGSNSRSSQPRITRRYSRSSIA